MDKFAKTGASKKKPRTRTKEWALCTIFDRGLGLFRFSKFDFGRPETAAENISKTLSTVDINVVHTMCTYPILDDTSTSRTLVNNSVYTRV